VPEKKSSARHDDANIRRAQIVDEAICLVGQRGYNGFTIQQLARRCGLTNGGVLYHFPSKKHLLIGVVDEYTRRDGEAISSLITKDVRRILKRRPTREHVLHILRIIVSYSSTHPDLARLLAMLRVEAIEPEHPVHTHLKAASKSALARYTQLLIPIAADPLSTARRVDALMNGLTLQWLCEGQSFDLMAEWDRAIDDVLPPAK
jgi:AcrR family transcriptional regulator